MKIHSERIRCIQNQTDQVVNEDTIHQRVVVAAVAGSFGYSGIVLDLGHEHRWIGEKPTQSVRTVLVIQDVSTLDI